MAAVSQRTLSWLWDVLQREYREPQRAYADVAQTLALNPTFAPRTDVYTHENGASALLLNLKGNIPVNFRGSQYRFPVAIWLPHTYPYDPPMFYVAPTDDMMIRPGQHVSPSDGRIYHPYLARWRESWERSTVTDFLKLLADVFTREPPVMSRNQANSVQNQSAPPPRPPPPNEQRGPPARPPSVNMGSAAQPPPPPPPPKTSDQMTGSPGPLPNQQRPGRYDGPPPLPNPTANPRPPSIGSPPIQSFPPQPRPYPTQSSSLRQSYPAQQNAPGPMSPNMMQPGQRHSIAGPQMAAAPQQMPSPYQQDPRQHQQPLQSIMTYPNQQPAQYQQPVQQQRQIPQARPPPVKPQQPNIMDDSPFEVSLGASTANLPTPAIPPNPEKQHILQSLQSTLLTTLQTQITQSFSALTPLQSQHAALQIAQQNLQQELNQLQLLHSQLQQNVESLTTTIAAADRTVTSARNESGPSKIPSIDDLVIPPTVVARQLYDSVAEQRGYEAAIFALTEGFVRGRIGGEMWARKTRECAREEFRRKWLIKRVGKGMGLDMSQTESSA